MYFNAKGQSLLWPWIRLGYPDFWRNELLTLALADKQPSRYHDHKTSHQTNHISALYKGTHMKNTCLYAGVHLEYNH